MSVEPLWFVGNRNPSITQTITANGVAVDLTAATVKFRMRRIDDITSALKVDAAATIITPAAGTVRYDWAAADVDTVGSYLCWWQVTIGGKTQDLSEAVIEFRLHTGGTPILYVEPEALKDFLEASGTRYLDAAAKIACSAASRGIDLATNRRFYPDPDATSVRYYTPTAQKILQIDDLITLTSLTIDRNGTNSFVETWTQNTDFVLEPLNAPVELPARPYEYLETRRYSGRWLPIGVERSVKVTGKFGWPVIPDEVKTCAIIIAEKLLKRIREAPFGIVAVGGPDTGVAMRIAKTDPDVAPILAEYNRSAPWL